MVAVSRRQIAHLQPDALRPSDKVQAHLLKGLAASLILRSVEDLRRWEQFHCGKPPNRTAFSRREAHRDAAHAVRWINGGTIGERITFAECCDVLSMHPQVARDRILCLIDLNALDAALEPPMLLTAARCKLKKRATCRLTTPPGCPAPKPEESPSLDAASPAKSPATHVLTLSPENPFSTLSERQIQIVQELASGDEVATVAKRIHLSAKTVESHKYRIMQTLNVHNRVKLALLAVRHGLVSLN